MLKTQMFTWLSYEESKERGYSSDILFKEYGLLLCEHGPTHIDAISHFDPSPDALSIDKTPLERFHTEGVCLDVSKTKPEEFITTEVLRKALERGKLDIKRGDTVLLYTGHYNRTYAKGDMKEWLSNYTGLTKESAEWLADRGVVNIGIDQPSIDSARNMTPGQRIYPAHLVCRERKILNTENMANLDKVRNKRFIFIAFPLKIRGGTGSPVRAIALLKE